ncbi:MAG TPA: adenosylcobinamide amidohydrolase [Polyangiales bacterium]
MELTLSSDGRFLSVMFERPQRTLGWALVGAGFGLHRGVVWHYVQRAELPFEVDPTVLLRERLAQRGYRDVVGLLTARTLAPYADACAHSGDVRARAIVTVGLGNALCAGDPVPTHPAAVGTINVLCHVSSPLNEAALIEALALASEARTAALLELDYPSVVSGQPASGTGTDCIVIACPADGAAQPYAGKHTNVGSALGAAVRSATSMASRVWLAEQAPGLELGAN